MKKLILVILFAVVATHGFAQQWELGTNFNYTRPVGSMAENIRQGFGITLAGARLLKNSPFAVGAEFSYNAYGHEKTRQQYTFDDGSITETNVIVTNAFSTLFVTGKVFFRKDHLISPYLSTKLGYSWYRTTLTIEDPEDPDGCHPLESDLLLRDGTFTASGGAGLRIDFTSVFKKIRSKTWYVDISAHMTQGGNVQYMNVHKSTPQPTPERDVVTRFINVRTQVVHEHHVGHVYSSLVEMMEYRLGVIYKLGRQQE